MLSRIFVAIACLLILTFAVGLWFVYRPAPVPLPSLSAPLQPVSAAPATAPATFISKEAYATTMARIATATQRYGESRGHRFTVDLSQADGGLQTVLVKGYVPEGLPLDNLVYWRLIQGDGNLVLCAHYIEHSQAYELESALAEAVVIARLQREVSHCGADAFGVRLAAGPTASGTSVGPGLPPLPPQPIPGMAPEPQKPTATAGPAAVTSRCEADAATEERLIRLL